MPLAMLTRFMDTAIVTGMVEGKRKKVMGMDMLMEEVRRRKLTVMDMEEERRKRNKDTVRIKRWKSWT